jgi:hypothetical protein
LIISHEHRFIFVKTAKTAGTSVEVLLSQVLDETAVATPFFRAEPGHQPRNYRGLFDPISELRTKRRAGLPLSAYRQTWRHLRTRLRFFHHMPAWQIRLREPELWSEYHTFCVERDPYAKAVSGWLWLRSSRGVDIDFDDYLIQLESRARTNLPAIGMWPYNLPNYTDIDTGKIMVDDVIDFDDLVGGLSRNFAKVGLDIDLSRLPRAKRDSTSTARPSMTPEQTARVEKIFAREIATRPQWQSRAETAVKSVD